MKSLISFSLQSAGKTIGLPINHVFITITCQGLNWSCCTFQDGRKVLKGCKVLSEEESCQLRPSLGSDLGHI